MILCYIYKKMYELFFSNIFFYYFPNKAVSQFKIETMRYRILSGGSKKEKGIKFLVVFRHKTFFCIKLWIWIYT